MAIELPRRSFLQKLASVCAAVAFAPFDSIIAVDGKAKEVVESLPVYVYLVCLGMESVPNEDGTYTVIAHYEYRTGLPWKRITNEGVKYGAIEKGDLLFADPSQYLEAERLIVNRHPWGHFYGRDKGMRHDH